MGTVLTNPFELNFGGLAARNAENITFAADPTDSDGDGTVDTFVQGNTTYQKGCSATVSTDKYSFD